MIVRVLDSALIEDFNYEDSTELCSIIKNETEKIIQLVKNEKLIDWEICLRFCYNNVKQILIYSKNKSYPKEKYKDITIHIPMPIKSKVEWGVELEQHIYGNENHLDNMIKKFICLDVDYSKFVNRRDYILDCMRRAVKSCFENGFTINGIKVKI